MPERAKDKRNRQPRSRAIKEEAFGTAPSPSFQASPSVPHVTFCCSHAWRGRLWGALGLRSSLPHRSIPWSRRIADTDQIQMEDSCLLNLHAWARDFDDLQAAPPAPCGCAAAAAADLALAALYARIRTACPWKCIEIQIRPARRPRVLSGSCLSLSETDEIVFAGFKMIFFPLSSLQRRLEPIDRIE